MWPPTKPAPLNQGRMLSACVHRWTCAEGQPSGSGWGARVMCTGLLVLNSQYFVKNKMGTYSAEAKFAARTPTLTLPLKGEGI